jgi:predicted DNA-binding transcriptional regulator AlpA
MASATQLARELKAIEHPITLWLLTAEDVALITGPSIETLAQWRSQRRGIPFMKLSRNVVRYRQSDLDTWLQERIVRVERDPSHEGRHT